MKIKKIPDTELDETGITENSITVYYYKTQNIVCDNDGWVYYVEQTGDTGYSYDMNIDGFTYDDFDGCRWYYDILSKTSTEIAPNSGNKKYAELDCITQDDTNALYKKTVDGTLIRLDNEVTYWTYVKNGETQGRDNYEASTRGIVGGNSYDLKSGG